MMTSLHLKLSKIFLTGMILAGCQHPSPVPTPAQLLPSQMQAACLKQIQASIERDIGEPVVLTEAVFAKSDVLSLSLAPILDPQGRLAQGRVRGIPESYRLSKRQHSCYLLREKTMQSTLLDACQCEALAAR
jgi:hypothetical protein